MHAAPPPVRASQPPFATIPISQLGFAAPGEFYLGTRQSLVSLDFLDEDRLLFSFRVPGLYRRDSQGEPTGIERHIRAVVLHIPDGAVQAETLWTVHDRWRYLYMLDNARFVFRDNDTLQLGDSSLQLTRWLHFPGPVRQVEVDPSREYLMTNSLEPEASRPKPDQVPAPSTAQATVTTDKPAAEDAPEYVLRVFHRVQNQSSPVQSQSSPAQSGQSPPETAQVMLFSRTRGLVHLPMNSEGYLESLRGRGAQWLLNLDYFTGGTTRVGAVDSICVPTLDFLSQKEFLSTSCASSGASWLEAFTLDGRHLWKAVESETSIWPVLVVSRNGAVVARETLHAIHPISSTLPLGTEDIERQQVNLYDVATGKQLLHAEPSPIFDAGGNVALSPSGRRAAILMDGNIQIFDLGTKD